MSKYIQTKIRKLDNGDAEVESQLVFSTVETIPAGAADMPSVIDAAKRKTRDAIFQKLYEKNRTDAARAFAKILLEIDTLEFGWRKMKARRVLDEAFVPLLNAGKWLEKDAGDLGE